MVFQLNEQQIDSLCELINIGFGRAANALSLLVGQRVIIDAPFVKLYLLSDLHDILETLSDGDLTSVHQVFSGRISGTAILLMDENSSSTLVDIISGDSKGVQTQNDHHQAVMEEIGNILLNAFTGSFGNLLQVHISFTVPQVRYISLQNMINSLMIDQRELEYALVVRVNFQLVSENVSGYVLIVMGIHSMQALIETMRAFGYIE
jgi:chemotaxis protein CheC